MTYPLPAGLLCFGFNHKWRRRIGFEISDACKEDVHFYVISLVYNTVIM